jgi:SAM-dependent methyltransferase
LDISPGVSIAAQSVRDMANAAIIQGNILRPPLKPQSFDVVWSEGVIHHTPDAKAAFQQLARLLKPGGRIYIWLYPRTVNPYRLARDLLPGAWRLPSPVLLVLCRVLAVPMWLLAQPLRLIGVRRRSFGEIAFGLHDNLSPRYQSRHSVDEVCKWFNDAGLVDIEAVPPPVGVRGRAPQ